MSTRTLLGVYRCLAKLSPGPLPSPVHRGDIVTFGWWASRGKRTHTEILDKGRRKNGAAGSRERRGRYKMTQQQNRFPESWGRHGRLPGPRRVLVNSRGSPSSRPPGRAGGRPGDSRPPGCGREGAEPGRILPPTVARGWGAATPSLQVPALRLHPPSRAPRGSGQAPCGRATTRSGGRRPFPPARPDAPTPGSDTHQSRRRRRLLLAPRSLGSQLPRRRRRLRDTDPGLFKITRPAPFHRRIP